MRRTEREITDQNEIEDIIARCDICRIALCKDGKPYMVPMNFGYKDRVLYLHSAHDGEKMDIIKENPNLCFEMEVDTVLVPGEIGCKWTMHYKSVIGFGVAEIVTDTAEKSQALDIIMEQYCGNQKFDFIPKVLDMMSIIKVPVDEMTGKKAGSN